MWAQVFAITVILTANSQSTSIEKSPTSGCGDVGDCISNCENKCGCDRSVVYIYNETTNECVLDYAYLKEIMVEKYNTSEIIGKQADRVFNGLVICVIGFIACALLCVLSACVYCCRMNIMDYKLKSDYEAVRAKMGRGKSRKLRTIKEIKPLEESCTVVVEDAGIYVA